MFNVYRRGSYDRCHGIHGCASDILESFLSSTILSAMRRDPSIIIARTRKHYKGLDRNGNDNMHEEMPLYTDTPPMAKALYKHTDPWLSPIPVRIEEVVSHGIKKNRYPRPVCLTGFRHTS